MIKIPEISIIIPCYNAEKYIEKCLNSVINQTLKNIEIILVNDGSTDSTLSILYQYASIDSRIIVIDKHNEGVSIARNIGIKKSNGEYIMFIDSDDWIDFDTCEIALEEIKGQNADVVMWSYVREFSKKSLLKNIYDLDIIIFEESDVEDKLFRRILGLVEKELQNPENMDALNPVWNKLYSSKLIKENNIQFVDLYKIGTGEDGLFNLEVFNYASRIIYINKHFYHYLKTNEASCTTLYKDKLYHQWNNLFDIMTNYIRIKKKKNFDQALNNRICWSVVGLGLNICNSKQEHLTKIRDIRNILSSERYFNAIKNLKLKHFPICWKLFFLTVKFNFYSVVYLQLYFINKIIRRNVHV